MSAARSSTIHHRIAWRNRFLLDDRLFGYSGANMGEDKAKCSSFRAIAVGSLVDIAGTIMVSAITGAVIVAAASNRFPGAAAEDIQELVADSFPLMLMAIIAGGACSFAGAYVAARLAPCAEVVHAFAVGLLGIALPTAFTDQTPPHWAQASATVLVLGLSLLAGRVAGPRAHAPDLRVKGPVRLPPPLPVAVRPTPPPPPPTPPLPCDVSVI